MKPAWVPFPAPGPPSNISRMPASPPRVRFLCSRRLYPGEAPADPFEVLLRIDTRLHWRIPEGDRDAVPVGERPQLLERLETLRGGLRQAGVFAEIGHAIRVKADMPECRETRRQYVPRGGEGVAGKGDGGT